MQHKAGMEAVDKYKKNQWRHYFICGCLGAIAGLLWNKKDDELNIRLLKIGGMGAAGVALAYTFRIK
jgi:hypothetical protein